MPVCCGTVLWPVSDFRGACADVLGTSCSLAGEGCTSAKGWECMAVPLVCCTNSSGVPLPTASGGGSGFSRFGRSVWLRGLDSSEEKEIMTDGFNCLYMAVVFTGWI